jgi:thymidylate synthase ThyX
MTRERQVYLLDPQKLNPETIAVTFAKTSRSPQSFREIAAELTGEKTTEFHEKWVVGYGHSSVAEHAVLHIAVENISRLAVECLESNRLASYTEKSTRYQKWGADDFLIPPELSDHPLKQAYQETCQMLFDTYHQALPHLRQVVAREIPCREGESEAAWDRRCRTEYIDVCRFVLPASALANVGMTINARALEHAIRKMLSHPLAEVRSIGEDIKRTAQAEVPTLVKYAEAVEYLAKIPRTFARESACLPADSLKPGPGGWCKLIHYDAEGEYRVLAAALYRGGHASYTQALETVQKASHAERQRLAALLLNDLGQYDMPLRELEHAQFTFDITLDQGAYNELKRHRMMTQSPQLLTTQLGYAIPRRFSAAGLEGAYRKAMDTARQLHDQLLEINPEMAAYVVPNAFNRRVLITLNLRSAFHFLSLRSALNAHFSIRRIAQKMGEEIRACSPLFGKYLRLAEGETWQDIEANYFTQTA